MDVEKEKLKGILQRSRFYAEQANQRAEALHDDQDGEYYMDGVQYEIMEETRELMRDIDSILMGIEKK